MNRTIRLSSQPKVEFDLDEELEHFNEKVQGHQSEDSHSNAEAPATWIVRGMMKYVNDLDAEFLGEGNEDGLPGVAADQFANNYYRLYNGIKLLAELWKIDWRWHPDVSLINDLRTIIVHTGEKVTGIQSLDLQNYRSVQLGRIFSKANPNDFFVTEKTDYRIQVWADKIAKNTSPINLDFHDENETYVDLDILLNARDVRNLLLSEIKRFIHDTPLEKTRVKKRVSNIVDRVVRSETHDIDFDKVIKYISSRQLHDYVIEGGREYWMGFGLQRIYEFVRTTELDVNVRNEIQTVIENVVRGYWEAYRLSEGDTERLPTLAIDKVFEKYTPEYSQKSYLEGEKLFTSIANRYNYKDEDSSPDIDYLLKFLNAIYEAGIQIPLEGTVDTIVSRYYVESVRVWLSVHGNE